MVVKRKQKKQLLVTSLIITIVIFSIGFVLGWTLDHFKADDVLTRIKQSELDTESFLVEQQFVDNYGGGDRCTLLTARIDTLQKTIRETGEELSRWDQGNLFNRQDFDYLKRKYVLLEVRFLMLLEDLEQTCGTDYNVIIYFYQIDQDESARQGYVLDGLVRTYDDLIVLSVDKDYLDEPLVELLISKYDITTAPTLIINDKIKLEGFTPRAQIESAVK